MPTEKKHIELIRVERFKFEKDCTIGKLFVLDKFVGFTVEDEIRNVKVHGETAIDAGEYELALRHSPKFSRFFNYDAKSGTLLDSKNGTHQLVWLLNVPNFKFILLHWGNTASDSEGCLIVGSKLGVLKNQTAVLSSRVLYKQIYPTLFKAISNKNNHCVIKIENNYE